MNRLPFASLIAILPCCAAPTDGGAIGPEVGEWTGVVVQHLDTLLEHGTDTYGEIHSPLLMAVIDARTLESPEHPEDYGSLVRLEDRIHRRGERGSNLWYDQSTLRALYRVGELTGDAKYAEAADAYVAYAFDNCRKPNGLLAWGTHIHWDCYEDRIGGDGDGTGPHEILVHMARATDEEHYLDLARDLASEAVAKLLENGILKGHPAKPYYEVTDGVGLLLVALLELDAPEEQLPAAF